MVVAINLCKAYGATATELNHEIRISAVGKKVCDFRLDSINLTDPLDYYLSRSWVRATGKNGLWHNISTKKFALDFDPEAPDEIVEERTLNRILNDSIISIISYRDSAAVILTQEAQDDYFLLNLCWIEDGRWVNGGQDYAESEAQAVEKASRLIKISYANIPRIESMSQIPTDTTKFVDFVKSIHESPEEFILGKLKKHRLVINGEYHRRKVSWDMLKRLIAMDGFAETTGCIFLEDPSWRQFTMNEFMESDSLDVEKIYEIFRDSQTTGWFDRGEMEFLCELWHLNKSLPAERRIAVILTDYQLPYSRLKSGDDLTRQEDRDTHMAETIFNYLQNSSDRRSSLFLVGCAHAHKHGAPGFNPTMSNGSRGLTAGSRLCDLLGGDNVFTIFQHAFSSDNNGRNKSPIRGGIFDYAFAQNDNRPIGFDLKGTPFGEEPFDGFYERKYLISSGSYYDNYDGYLFLHQLENEPKSTPLIEIYTDEFVAELKRRAEILGTGERPDYWLGRKANDLTVEYIRQILR